MEPNDLAAPTYIIFLGVAEDPTSSMFDRQGTLAFILIGPEGELKPFRLAATEPVNLSEGRDCHYAAIATATHLIPSRCHLHVVSRQERYHGNATFIGPLNVSTRDRRAANYTKKDGKTLIDKWEHLRELDTLLDEKEVTTSGAMPATAEQKARVEQAYQWAKYTLRDIDRIRGNLEPQADY